MRIHVAVRCRDEIEAVPWFIANCTFADKIHVCDGGSTDGTLEWLRKEARKDKRIHLTQFKEEHGFYQRQAAHLNTLMNKIDFDDGDWVITDDADDIFTVDFQDGIREYLSNALLKPKTAAAFMFYYLCPNWHEYYTELSMYVWHAAHSWIPLYLEEDTTTEFAREQPENLIEAPHELAIVHFNYAMKDRFERKRKLYEKKFGYPSWHPDEKYPQRSELPEKCRWYGPDGTIRWSDDMDGVFA